MLNIITTFAADVCKCIDTNMFGRVCSTGDGNEIYYILNIVINVLTAGIGILSIIGIAYFGVQYLTAKDDPAQVKKAKSRLMAIIIGLAAYATIYAGLYFLLPNFTAESGSFGTCTEASQGDPHPVKPDPEPEPEPDPDPDPEPEPDPDPDPDPEPGPDPDDDVRTSFCGPEDPGTHGQTSSVTNKNAPGAGTTTCVKWDKDNQKWGKNYTNCRTIKYTTLNANKGRTFYIFRQANEDWGSKLVSTESDGKKNYMTNYGCKRTSLATIAMGFGASLSPHNFVSSTSLSWTSKAHLNYQKISTDSDSLTDAQILDLIWGALLSGGAAIIRVESNPYTSSGSHYIPIVDYRIKDGRKEVFLANTVLNHTGWEPLSNFEGRIRGHKKTGEQAFIFTPKSDYKNKGCNNTGSGDSGDSGDTGDSGTDTPDINSIGKGDTCGPEKPSRSVGVALVNPLSSLNKKIYGSLTKKYTTTKNRVYYVYRQDDDPWKDASAGGSDKMKDEGESRTLIADIMRSFGAEVTPLHFSGSGISGKAGAISRAESLISKLSLPLAGGINKYTSDYENRIKTTLNGGGAVLIKVKGGIFNHKSGATHIALIDIKEVSGKIKVFLVDSFGRTKASKDSSVPVNNWVDLNIIVDTSKTGIQEIHTFVPKPSAMTCSPADGGPIELLEY